MCNSNEAYDSFEMLRCFYDVYKGLQELNPKLAQDYIEIIMDYGFERKKPDKSNPLWIYGIGAAFSLIDGSWKRDAEIWAEILTEET